MRGRLLFPFVVEIARLDPATMAAVEPPGGGDSGFDDDFREPRLEADVVLGSKPIRRELPAVKLPAQIEPEALDAFESLSLGGVPRGNGEVVLHFRDLERLSLVDASGRPLLRQGDRLARILDKAGRVLFVPRDPPGLYVERLEAQGWGLGGTVAKRNLLVVVFGERQSGALARAE